MEYLEVYYTSQIANERQRRVFRIALDLFHTHIRRRRDGLVLGPHVDDHEDRLRAVGPDQFVNFNIVLLDLRTCRVKPDDDLARIHLLVHAVHGLEVVVVEVPDRVIFGIFFKGHGEAVRHVHATSTPRP